MNQKIFIFYARPYKFTDEATGQERTGVSVNYLVCSDLKDCGQHPDGSLGYSPCKDSLPLDSLNKLSSVPAFYDGQFVLSPSKGQTRLKLSDVTVIK